jgi:hypothetical protein
MLSSLLETLTQGAPNVHMTTAFIGLIIIAGSVSLLVNHPPPPPRPHPWSRESINELNVVRLLLKGGGGREVFHDFE